jgi:hypothetical protein
MERIIIVTLLLLGFATPAHAEIYWGSEVARKAA